MLTACALVEFAEAGVDVAVLEAGLGGRYDATNVVDSRVAVLTNVGLEHTRYLGPTVRDIALEKLDVVRPGRDARARRGPRSRRGRGRARDGRRARRDARRARAGARRRAARRRRLPAPQLRRRGRAARGVPGPRSRRATRSRAAAAVDRRARAASRSTTARRSIVFDGAHNDGGIEALAESLPAFLAGRRLVAVVSILDDKDAAGMLGGCSSTATRSSAPPARARGRSRRATLASLAGQLGGRRDASSATPTRALELARELAGPDGVVLATGSIYLIAELLRPPGAHAGSML